MEKYIYIFLSLHVMIKIYFREHARCKFEEISCPREIQIDCKLHKKWLLKYTEEKISNLAAIQFLFFFFIFIFRVK